MPSVPRTLDWWFFFFPGWFRLDGWLLGRMASCQHLQSPALSGRSRQLVESSSRPATVLEDQGESLEWSLMLLMEVCGSEYALPDFFPHALSYSMMVSTVRYPRWCALKEITYGLLDAQGYLWISCVCQPGERPILNWYRRTLNFQVRTYIFIFSLITYKELFNLFLNL